MDAPAAAPAAHVPGEPSMRRVLKAWKVEFFKDRTDLVVDDTNVKQSVHIHGCDNCTVHVKGKVNEILIDRCNKVSLLFEGVIGSCDIVNSTKTRVQVVGEVPSVQVDRSHGVTVYLPRDSLAVNVFTVLSTEVNLVTSETDDADSAQKEYTVPQQFVSKFVRGKLVTTPIEL
eukprot:Unigene5934_Nuclearia_a/m.18159 Unigene5934_Nuclearia_a/g.18159  ORF Unigene5934_Nuclearia_a/g.18159 Unigene5934_Nuclearia_a/m.18159 type:complete len:173 (-) Unigene5934_Nuclearia_a:139-657(-)